METAIRQFKSRPGRTPGSGRSPGEGAADLGAGAPLIFLLLELYPYFIVAAHNSIL